MDNILEFMGAFYNIPSLIIIGVIGFLLGSFLMPYKKVAGDLSIEGEGALRAEADSLRARVQDLESRVAGRNQEISDLKTKLAASAEVPKGDTDKTSDANDTYALEWQNRYLAARVKYLDNRLAELGEPDSAKRAKSATAKKAPAKKAPIKAKAAAKTKAVAKRRKDVTDEKTPRAIGTIIKEALLQDSTNEEVLAAVQFEKPEAKTSTSTVSWYRNQMRKAGEPVKTSHEVKRARKEAAKKAPAKKAPIKAKAAAKTKAVAKRRKDVTDEKTPRAIGTIIKEALLQDSTNEEVLAAVQFEKPEAKTSTSTVSWYRNQMRKAGEPVKTSHEVKRTRKEAAKKAPAKKAPIKAKAAAKTKAVAKRRKNVTDEKTPRAIGTIIKETLLQDSTNEEVLAAVQFEKPEAKTSTATVSWYRNQMRKAGEPVKTSHEVKRARKETAKKAPAKKAP